MILSGRPVDITADITRRFPRAFDILRTASPLVTHGRQEVEPYQAMALAMLAADYNKPNANILEIGTYYGYTAAVMATAAPLAHITTLNTHPGEVTVARKALASLANVKVECAASWDYLKEYTGPALDMIFVDGDHKRVALDLPWFDWLRVGGLMVFHDYTPLGAPRHCPPVYNALNAAVERIGRGFDVIIIDDRKIGMAGWYKQKVSEYLVSYPEGIG